MVEGAGEMKQTVETVADFINACSHEIKRYLLLGRKVTTNLDSIFKSIDITLPTKVHLVKAIFCHPAYSTYTQSTSCEMLGWMKLKLDGIKTAGRNGNNLRYADDTTFMAKSEEPLDESERGE